MSELTIEEMINDVIRKSRWVEDRLPLQRSRSALLSRIASIQKEADDSKSKVKPIHFKTSEQERFIWWIHQVYARNVQDLIAEILEACTYQDEATAASGKYGLPIKCFEHMERLRKYSHGIYDGTYLDVEISTDVKKGIPENKPAYNENANSLLRSAWMIANRNGEQTNWEAFKNAVYKELVVEHNAKTSTDNNKPSISDVSVTQED